MENFGEYLSADIAILIFIWSQSGNPCYKSPNRQLITWSSDERMKAGEINHLRILDVSPFSPQFRPRQEVDYLLLLYKMS